MFWMLRNSSGKKDAVLTMAVAGFALVLVKILLAGVVVQISGKNISFGSIDGSTIAAILTPTLGAYVTRRYTDKKYSDDSTVPPTDDSARRNS